ncbi:MAG: hypothetical protein H0X01_01095 [Nitrospira sp.]|nr:hypothetical protein [Nitrospira sp.]
MKIRLRSEDPRSAWTVVEKIIYHSVQSSMDWSFDVTVYDDEVSATFRCVADGLMDYEGRVKGNLVMAAPMAICLAALKGDYV